MDSNTFTCRDCERTLPIEEAAANNEASAAEICVECEAGAGPSDGLAANGAQASSDGDEPHPGRVDREDHDPQLSPGEAERTAPEEVETGHPQGATEDPPGEHGPEAESVFWETDPDQPLRSSEESSTSEPSDSTAREGDSIDRRIDSWREQLLDLTRRNTLIDFTETKTKTLPLAGKSPTAVADQLQDGNLRIKKQPDGDAEPRLRADEVLSTRSPEETTDSLYRIGLNEKQFLRERGVDTLYLALGTLQWYPPDDPNEVYGSPLFLAAVDLEQQPVAGGDLHNYVIEPEIDELLLNPALRKKLSSDVSLNLPADEAIGLECIDAAFQAVDTKISGFDDWTIGDEVVLGVFDFAKYSIYTDLEENRQEIRADPLIQALDDNTEPLQTAEGGIETVAPAAIDEEVDPEDVYQVLDADSSQQAAIEAAKRGKSIVIQGPPGTGKSQTISNIIAEKLAAGETVLFVSEKQAALNVVKDRLDTVGVGRFCLEAHGRKATKSNVLDSLERELQSNPVKEAPERAEKLEQYSARRDTLNAFGETLLTPPDGFGITPHEAFGNVAAHRDVPDIELGIEDPLGLDQETYETAIAGLRELTYFETEIEGFDTHPWRHTTLTQWKVNTATEVERTVGAHADSVAAVQEHAETLAELLEIEITSCSHFEAAVDLAEHVEIRPEVDWQRQHFAEEFIQLGSRLEEFANHMQRIQGLRTELQNHYHDSFLDADGAALHAAASRYGAFRFLRPGYYSTRNELESHTKAGYDPAFADLTEDARKLMELQQLSGTVDEFQDVQAILGPLYEGLQTSWGQLLTVQAWVAKLADFPFDTSALTESLINDTLPALPEARAAAAEARAEFHSTDAALREILVVDEITVEGTSLYEAPIDATRLHLEMLGDRVDELEDWVEFTTHLEDLETTIADEYVTRFLENGYETDNLVPAFEKRFFTRWLNQLYDRTPLGEFNAETYSKYLNDFRRLDQERQELAKVAVQHLVTGRRPQLNLEHADSSQQVILRREIQKQRQHKPLRELFDEAGEFITKLKPCFMMSPLSVAQYLKKDSITFDTVIFDEASQVMPEDAVSSLIRADQAIIAGDTKQLPPTTFFDTDTAPTEGVREDLDSILEEAAAILPEINLTWHYRSRTAELIEFSNQLYYNGRLQTFPENNPETTTGVEFEYVEDGVYDRGGTRRNEVEAERVVDLIADHAAASPEKSLGVVAFSVAQEEAIREALETRRVDDETLDRFVDEDDILGEFFVKNLEMVQGDERDRMLFSVGYGPDEHGELSMNFGPLNQQGGERRLNVAVTRARERVTVVSSLLPEEIDLSRTSSTGVNHFKQYLEYARKGPAVLSSDGERSAAEEVETAFQQSVSDELAARGYEVDVVRSSGYSLDLALSTEPSTDGYDLGLEFDASAYRWSNTARDRDRIRPSVLEALGWTVYRVWAPDWVTNPQRVLKQIEALVEDESADGTAASSLGDLDGEEEVQVATYEPEEYSRAELDSMRAGVETYRPATSDKEYDISIEEADPETLYRRLRIIVLEHGPIHREDAFRVIAEEFGEPRRTPTVNDALSEQLEKLINQRQIYSHEEFLWPQRQDTELVVRTNEDASRSIDRIPLEEIALGVALILDAGFSMSRDDLIVETTRLFGYERVGSRIRDRVNLVIDRLQSGGLVTDGDQLTLEASLTEVEVQLLSAVYTTKS